MTVLLLGFLLGLQHALEADHVGAVAALVSGSESVGDALRHGAVWGLGHTITLLVVGSALVLLGAHVPAGLASALEFAVGVMLVVLGGDVLRRSIRHRIHCHRHRHVDGTVHLHWHSHLDAGRHDASRHDHGHPRRFPMRSFLVGMMHGLAGTAAILILAAEAFASPLSGLLYIAIFGVGSILGMGTLSMVISVPMRFSIRSLSWMQHGLNAAIGAGTVVLGLVACSRIAQTSWTPNTLLPSAAALVG